MKLTYFFGCENFEDVRQRYRTEAKKLHPDLNPNLDATFFRLLDKQYKWIQQNTVYYPIPDLDEIPKVEVRETFEYKEKVRPKVNVLDSVLEELIETRNVRGHKGQWVYFNLIDFSAILGIDIKQHHLEKIALDAGYEQGWVYYKCRDLGIRYLKHETA